MQNSRRDYDRSDRQFYEHYFSGDQYEQDGYQWDAGAIATRAAVRRFITKQEGTLLEVGVGTGHFLAEVNTFRRVGIDLALATLQRARHIASGVPMAQADAQHLPFCNGVFDVIATTHVLEHIPDDQRVAREFHRVLKADGEMIAFVPAHMSGQLPQVEIEQMGHVRTYSRSECERMLKNLFDIEQIYFAHQLYNVIYLPLKRLLRYPNGVLRILLRDRKAFYQRGFYQRLLLPIILAVLDPLDRWIGRAEHTRMAQLLQHIDGNRCICIRACRRSD